MTVTAVELPSASLRMRKKSATRAALHRAALDLVGHQGLAAVTVEDIAAAANVSPRTFFNYFGSKEDAISGFDPAVLAETVERLRARPPQEAPPVALRAAVVEALSAYADHRELLERLQVVRADPHLLAHYVSALGETERQLVAALAERRGAADDYASLVVATTLAACRVAMLAWCEHGGRRPLAEELTFHLDVLGAGLAEPERN